MRNLILAFVLTTSFPFNLAGGTTDKTILFLGDSITAGYGLDSAHAYPSLIQKKIGVSRLGYRVINAGVSGDTTASGRARLSWLMREKITVLVVALGGNDGLRGVPVEATQSNLEKIIQEARKAQPGIKILLAGYKMPPNYGPVYTRRFEKLFSDVAKKEKVPFVPFFLEGVGGVAKMNQSDLIHPTKEGQERIADNIWKGLKPVLTEK